MKTLKFLFLTDTHILDNNRDMVIATCENAVKIAKENNCDAIIHGGDWLDSRRQASISTIETLRQCFEIFENAPMLFYSISGNHDKSDQSEAKSFVSAIIGRNKSHFEAPTRVMDMIDLYPYFPESSYPETGFKDTKDKIAICHAAFVGANNLGYKSKHGLDANWFSDNYRLTLVGHFHNRHKLRDNVIYTGSIAQTNFGEDEFKGFAIVSIDEDDELDVTYHKNDASPSYITHKVHVELGDEPDLDGLASDKSHFHRIELIGTRAAVDSIKKSGSLPAKIVKRYLDDDLEDDEVEIDFNSENVMEYFIKHCQSSQIDPKSSLFKLGKKVMELK